MPTIAEWLDGIVDHTLRTYEDECWACDEHGVREEMVDYEVPCDLCDENGRAKYAPDQPCLLCKGSKVSKKYKRVSAVCDICGGERTVRKPMWDPYVQATVLAAVVGAMSTARQAENFVTMNEALDWAEGYMREVARGAAATISPEDVESAMARLKKAGQVVPRSPVTLSGGALTPEELKDLGIEPDGEVEFCENCQAEWPADRMETRHGAQWCPECCAGEESA
jgi:hypothetical protein